ncbi:Adenosylmethionine-8-amino-7-oxononanoate aminotransferase [hydrothermal vent metagenome]|uniref:Adenosylmethionine-8-amino-7-oxononanoate aminotransferase n=1 Tax=hydrothermal vent metagenome TaxID=652676 RepID=A0A1W1CVX3_9ZZZZ
MNDLEFDKNHIWHPYTSIPNPISSFLVKSADGVYLNLVDEKGNNYQCIDGMSSWWAVIHGYNHPKLNQAITKQLENMAHTMFGGLTHQGVIELSRKLIKLTKLEKVFFSDSGSVAVEVALKMALQYWQNRNKPNKKQFLTLENGYHGDTFATMALGSGFHQTFNHLEKPFFVEVENSEQLEQTLKENHQNIAAMVIEPIVQGAGGMRFYSAEYLKDIRKLCSKYDVLLVVDEIATGFGRTGKLFACEFANIQADILCLGKALTGGYLSLGATLTTQEISKKIGVLMHGPTFMANPLACSVANTSIDLLLNSNWQEQVLMIEKILKTELLSLKNKKNIADVRVLGAIGVIEMSNNIELEEVQKQCVKNGIWLRPFGKLLYTMPPFMIKKEQLKKITNVIKKVIDNVSNP